MPTSPNADRLPWFGVAVVALALLVASLAIVTGLDDGPRPPFAEPGFVPEQEPVRFGDGALHLAGSGSNLPLTRALARAHRDAGGRAPVVHPSIGSGGGVRALLDGAIDVALVSRPLKPAERERGLVATPYARIPVVVAAHVDVPDRGITGAQLVDIYAGRRTTWSDGSRIFVLQREPGDSSHGVVGKAVADFDSANEIAYRESRWRVLFHEAAMLAALANTLGSVGLYAGAVEGEPEVKALSVDGVAPTPDAVASSRYPFAKQLAFVTVGPPQGEAQVFIDFVASSTGRALIERLGAVALTGGP